MEIYENLNHPIALTIFILTLIIPILIGLLTMKKTKSQSDFLIGGRTINQYMVALSAVSSGRSSWLVLGVSGMAYKMGTGAVWAVVGYIIVEMVQFIYIGRKLRSMTGSFGSLTLLDFFETKFQDHQHLLRITGAIIIGIFLTAYVGAQLNAGAKSLSMALGLPLILTLFISVVLIMIYMLLGGYIAVVYNDMIRAVIMLIGLVIFPVYGLIKVGGFQILLKTLHELDPTTVDPFSLGMGVIIGFLGIGLGSPGQPHIVVRYMSINDADQLRLASVVGTFWNVVMAWGALFIGLIGRMILPEATLLPDQNPEMIYLVLSSEFFGPILYGLLIGGIFAAILSTADSQLLVVSSTFVRDIYEKILKKDKNIEESKKLSANRLVLVICGLLAVILAYTAKDLIFWLVLFAWGGLGAAFGTSLILTLYWKRVHKWGIFAGMITGTLMTIIWRIFLKASTGVYELIPAFLSAALVIILVSLILNRRMSNTQ